MSHRFVAEVPLRKRDGLVGAQVDDDVDLVEYFKRDQE